MYISSTGLGHQVHPPQQVLEGKEKTSLCRSLRVLICKPPFTLVGKIAGARPVITFPNSSVSVDLQSLERILAAILNTLEWKLLLLEIRALTRDDRSKDLTLFPS